MSTAQFDAAFARYVEQARQARDSDQHHDHRRQLFLGFLDDAFEIKAADVEVEQYHQIAGRQVSAKGIARVKKGWIDAVFRDLIFEFKRDLKREEADGLRELRDYLSTIDNGAECVGLMTDGLKFIAYTLDADQPDGLLKGDSFDLEKAAPAEAFLWLDAYLLKQKHLPPTSADIVHRFGLTSPTFGRAASILRAALRVFAASEANALAVKRQQWAFHLARVYGSADASNDEMFVRHTYLCQFAKILAYTASFGVQRATLEMEQIIDGRAFEVLGVSNVGEQDFFAWALAPEVREQTLAVLRQIAGSLVVYDLARIDEDLLKQLYQNLVEAETRHELGEFYTPDWLAELTLREIGYHPGQSLLDPACGSGTFLFLALRLLKEQGVTGAALVDFALENIMGMDVHPLAVTIARINYMLAILPHLRAGGRRGQRAIPVFLANSLQMPTSPIKNLKVIEVPLDSPPPFQIPAEAAQRPNELTEVLEQMGRFAERAAPRLPDNPSFVEFGKFALSRLAPTDAAETQRVIWNNNAKLLAKQIAAGRDSIWVYVLQNTSRPLILQHHKFDVVAGNPPWIAYRYLQDQSYQQDVKTLIREYGLLASSETKLNSVMELGTLFFEHCHAVYLKPGGTVAFVLPRSVLTGAKQHRAFQEKGFSRVLDLKGVAPLFGVECCVMIRSGDVVYKAAIPTTRFVGALPAHECSWEQASARLARSEGGADFARQAQVASPYYHPRFKQGATLVPRNLVFVTSAQPDLAPGELARSSITRSDPDVDEEAKAPWKGLRLQGHLDEEFLYATLLSKQMVPFGVRRLHLVALPVTIGIPKEKTLIAGSQPERFILMSLKEMRDTIRLARSADDWFEPAEQLWAQYRKSVNMSLWERYNYQQGITAQSAAPGYLMVYNKSGSNLASAVIDTSKLPIINGTKPRAFVAEANTYFYRGPNPAEAYFLSALLNAPCVDHAIKAHQPRGIYVGPRHITRLPFEVCPIPPFDPADPDHQRLAALSQQAHAAVAALDLTAGGVVAARKKAREAARAQIAEIDLIAQRLLSLAPAVGLAPEPAGEDEEEEEAEGEPGV